MKKLVKDLADKCKDAIEQAAHDSYYDNDTDFFDGCSCLLDLKGDDQVEVGCDSQGRYEVVFYKENENDCANIVSVIEQYLAKNADARQSWQEEFDNDIWRDVDPGCDPAFPHHGDFERWAYGH